MSLSLSLSICRYTYIYIYIYREREIERERERDRGRERERDVLLVVFKLVCCPFLCCQAGERAALRARLIPTPIPTPILDPNPSPSPNPNPTNYPHPSLCLPRRASAPRWERAAADGCVCVWVCVFFVDLRSAADRARPTPNSPRKICAARRAPFSLPSARQEGR